jgi:hypothetical protein
MLFSLSCCLILFSFVFPYIFWKKGKIFELAFSVSGSYFLMLPALYLFFNGNIPIPLDFVATQIPNIIYRDYGLEVFIVLLTWNIVNYLMLLLSNIELKFFKINDLPFRYDILIKLFFIYEMIAIYLFFAAGLGGGDEGAHWARSREHFMQNAGSLGLIASFLVAGLRYILLSIFICFLFNNHKTKVILLLLCICCLTDLYTTGNRISTLVACFGCFYVLLAQKQYVKIAIFTVFAIPFGVFMLTYRIIRSQLHSEESFIDGFSKGMDVVNQSSLFDSGIVFEFISGISESVNFNVLVGIHERFGNSVDFLYGSSYLKTLVWWVPRSIYPDKPITITMEANKVFAPYTDVSLVTTALGESYANFGLFTLITLPIFLLLFKVVIDNLFSNKISHFVKLIFGFLLFRMAYSDLFIYMLFGGLFLLLISSKYKIKAS